MTNQHDKREDDDRNLENEKLVAPEEEQLKGWLPEAEPTDGGAPAP